MTSEEKAEYNKNNLTGEFKDEYSFDDYNNITEKVHTETDTTKNSTVVSTYDKTRLSTQTENGNVITYTYDDNGNISGKTCTVGEVTTQTVFTYDTFDRTASITLGNGVTTSFAYNTDSDRVSKTTNGKATESILDNGTISADLINDNNTTTVKVFSEDNSVYCENGVFTYNIINSNGDLVATCESNGVDYKYNAYGIKLSDNTSSNPIGYRNYYYDTETGLYYLKARYYDPTTGQFTQEDTVQDDNLQYNLYGYCSANPVKYTDPSGHAIKWEMKFREYYNSKNYYWGRWGTEKKKDYLRIGCKSKYHIKYWNLSKKQQQKCDKYEDQISVLNDSIDYCDELLVECGAEVTASTIAGMAGTPLTAFAAFLGSSLVSSARIIHAQSKMKNNLKTVANTYDTIKKYGKKY